MIKAIIGLGNEGKEYEHTYHNVGAFATDELLAKQAEQGVGSFLFFQPPGFMNSVGLSIKQFLKEKKLPPSAVLVIHDDSDLVVGTFKLVRGGGSAGHKGIANIADELGTEDFWRLRIGVRDPNEQNRKKAGDFVLRKWAKVDEEKFETVLEQAWPKILKL